MFQKTTILGNIARDIKFKTLNSGVSMATTSIATSRKFKDRNGTRKSKTMFIDIVMFGRTAEIANQYSLKGSKVLIEGRLELEQWDDTSTGQKRSKHVIHVTDFVLADNKQPQQQPPAPQSHQLLDDAQQVIGRGIRQGSPGNQPQLSHDNQNTGRPIQKQNEIDMDEDEIPF